MAASFAIVQAAAATGGGNQSFTKAGFGTPNAAMFICTKAITNGTAAADATLSIGFTDGSTNRAVAFRDGDNLGTSQGYRQSITTELVRIIAGGGSVDGEANFNAWVTDGVQLAWGNNPAAGYLITCLLIKTDNAKVAHWTQASGNGSTSDINVGFEPDILLCIGSGKTFPTDATDGVNASFGFAVNKTTIESGANVVTSAWGRTTSLTQGYQRSTRANVNHNISTEVGFSRAIDITAFNAGPSPAAGFTATTRAGSSSSGSGYAYLALATGSLGIAVDEVDAPSATGNNTQTGPGFKPQLVITIGSNQTSYGVSSTDGRGNGFFISMVTANEEYCNEIAMQDNVNTMNTQSLVDNKAINHTLHNGTTEHVATYVSMDATGYTYNFSTAGTLRKWHALAVEAEAAAGIEILRRRLEAHA